MNIMDNFLPKGYFLKGPRHSYLLDRVLGKGGFGITYQGREPISNTTVAVKEYFPNMCQPCRMGNGTIMLQTQYQNRFEHGKNSFLNEAAMLKALDEIPTVVRVLDFFEANGTAYIVMEFLNGTTLRSMVEKNGPIPLEELIPRMLCLAQDISLMHERGVIHRDIAPDNIMWMPDNTLKLLDFGCARAMEDGRSMTVQLKPGFAPFEQYQTQGQGDYTDLYALCATIYYCITGYVPPAAPERIYALNDSQPDPLARPSRTGAALTPEWEELLMWGLTVYPSQRPQTVATWLHRAKDTPFAAHGRTLIQDRDRSQIQAQDFMMKWVLIGLGVAAAVSMCAYFIQLL